MTRDAVQATAFDIAIEPMTCWADAFNNQRGLVILRPGESTAVRCGVRIF